MRWAVLVGPVRSLLTDYNPEDSVRHPLSIEYRYYWRALQLVYGRQGGGIPLVIIWIPPHWNRSRITEGRNTVLQSISAPRPERLRIRSFWGITPVEDRVACPVLWQRGPYLPSTRNRPDWQEQCGSFQSVDVGNPVNVSLWDQAAQGFVWFPRPLGIFSFILGGRKSGMP